MVTEQLNGSLMARRSLERQELPVVEYFFHLLMHSCILLYNSYLLLDQ